MSTKAGRPKGSKNGSGKSRKVYSDQPIQWHLPTTAHDKCPRCGGSLGYLGPGRRACMGTCTGGIVWEARVTPEEFVRLAESGALNAYDPNTDPAPLLEALRRIGAMVDTAQAPAVALRALMAYGAQR